MTQEQSKFISEIAKYVRKYAPKYDIMVCSPIIAQAILESGWGKSVLSAKYHNYFGLKCGTLWTGKSVNMTTQEEYTPGTLTTIKDNFRVYDSMEDGVIGYFEFIQLARYANLKGITSPQKYLETIKADGYATGSAYVEKNMQLVNLYDLTKYDTISKEETGKEENMSVKTIIEAATKQMETWAKDDSHGYDQVYRWGEKGDYDCSAAVIQAWQNAGVPVKTSGASYTGNMLSVFKKCGFTDITSQVNKSNGSGLVRGDVLLNTSHHTAMYIGNGQEVEASINEKGGAKGGKPGDQTGKEFLIRSYRNYPWTHILRYTGGSTVAPPDSPSAILRMGSVGEAVKTLQKNLNTIMNAGLEVDGSFGNATYSAVIAFQKKYGLEVDGEVGVNTQNKINELLKPASSSPASGKLNATTKWKGKVTASSLNVRTWAGTDNPQCSFSPLKKGTIVGVCDSIKAADGSKWYYISYNKKYGFVSAEYVSK